MAHSRFVHFVLAAGVLCLVTAATPLSSEAKGAHCWRDQHNRQHCDNGLHKGWSRHYSKNGRYYYDDRRGSWYESRTGKIVKGGLVGAGIGAGAGYLLDRPLGKSAVLGAGIGAGVQATKTSPYMRRHPVVKIATYGAMTGAGASTILKRDGDPLKGALWGAAIGTGIGALKHMD